MYLIVWRFVVKRGRESEFEEHYGASGSWASLFARAEGFLGTQLMRDADGSRRYVTIDQWRSKDDFDRFFEANRTDYARLDALCAELTESEERLADSDTAAPPLHDRKS